MSTVDLLVDGREYLGLQVPENCTVEHWRQSLLDGVWGDQVPNAEALQCSQGGAAMEGFERLPEPPHRMIVQGPDAVVKILAECATNLTAPAQGLPAQVQDSGAPAPSAAERKAAESQLPPAQDERPPPAQAQDSGAPAPSATERKAVESQLPAKKPPEPPQPSPGPPPASATERKAAESQLPVPAKAPPEAARGPRPRVAPGARTRPVKVQLRGALSGEALATVQLRPSDPLVVLQRAAARHAAGPHLAAQLLRHGRPLRAHERQADVALGDGEVVEVMFRGCPLFTCSGDGTAKAWVGDQCSATLRGHRQGVLSVAVSPDGRTVATGSQDRSLKLWSVQRVECSQTLEAPGAVHSVAFSPSGDSVLAACAGGVAVVWSTAVGLREAVLAGHEGRVYSGAWSPDGHWIVTASADFTARVWSAATGECEGLLSGHRRVVRSAVFSPDGYSIATCSADGTAKLWSSDHGELLHDLRGHGGDVFSVGFSPCSLKLVTAASDSTARVWSTRSGELVLTLCGHEDTVRSAVFSLDGRGILTASADRTARMWDADSGESVLVLAGHSDTVTAAVFAVQCL